MTNIQLDSRTQKWIKQGRGKGSGKEYQPWLTVRDLSSSGRSHRVWGFHSQRTHHLFSDLELSAFLLLDWNPVVIDIREKFPLRIEDTFDIATCAGIRHPKVRSNIKVIYTDFFLDTSLSDFPRMAIQVKTSSDLTNPRTIEKLEIERRYWEMQSVSWYLLTEKQIPEIVTKNINWLYPAQGSLGKFEDTFDTIEFYLNFFLNNPAEKIVQAGKILDDAYSFPPGDSLQKIRSLLALGLRVVERALPQSQAWWALAGRTTFGVCLQELHLFFYSINTKNLCRKRGCEFFHQFAAVLRG